MQVPHIEMVLFDFDETIVRGKQGTQSRTRQLNPLSNDVNARNAKLTADVVDPLAFVSFVNSLDECGVPVGITSFGNGPPIRWYMEALFNPQSPTLDGATHPFERSVVARGDPIYGSLISKAIMARGSAGPGMGKVLMAELLQGELLSEQVLVFDDNWNNVETLRHSGYNAVHTPNGFNAETAEEAMRGYTFGNCL